jgi:hypothetical protein
MFNEVIKVLLYEQVVQVILVAYVGALLGEMRKELDDEEEVVLADFLVSWLGSGFSGAMIGLMLKGSVAKDKDYFYFVLGASGIAGYAGYKKSIDFALNLLTKLASNTNDDNGNKKSKKKKD